MFQVSVKTANILKAGRT